MKFKIGDATDAALCVALKHEFLRCDDAFKDFAASAKNSIVEGENRWTAFKTYNAYARFIHHLYEFMVGAAKRDRQDTKNLEPALAERYIAGHSQRILNNRRKAILHGTAPAWENHIGYYPEKIPEIFASNFRQSRNIASAHVTVKRSSLDLTKFYNQYHKYLHMLYIDARSWWGLRGDEFPDLREITSFSVLIKENPPPQT
jgi:hypothetical protein